MKSKTYLTELVCLNCGNIDVIERLKSHNKNVGHIKDLWCYKCKLITKHYEIIDKSLFYYYRANDDITLYIKSLLWPNEFTNNNIKIKKIESKD